MNVEKEIQQLQKRNTKVELEKKWETSYTRRLFIALITFFAAFFFLRVSGTVLDQRTLFISALIPAGAFLISTLTLPPLQKIWKKIFHRNS